MPHLCFASFPGLFVPKNPKLGSTQSFWRWGTFSRQKFPTRPGSHGTCIRWSLRNGCARMYGNSCYLICNWLDQERLQIWFFLKAYICLHTCATCSEIPVNISTMARVEIQRYFDRIWTRLRKKCSDPYPKCLKI